MRAFTAILGLMVAITVAQQSWAAAPGDDDARRSRAAERLRGKAIEGRPENIDPSALVTRMMERFDKDGDQKLDVTELTALLTSMRQRMGAERLQAGAGNTRKMDRNNNENAAGGDKPQRPGTSP